MNRLDSQRSTLFDFCFREMYLNFVEVNNHKVNTCKQSIMSPEEELCPLLSIMSGTLRSNLHSQKEKLKLYRLSTCTEIFMFCSQNRGRKFTSYLM